MQYTIIAQYREIFDRYLEEDLTNDDLKLGRKVDYFFKLKKMDKITEIVAFLRDKSISPNSLALADELEIMMTDEPIAEPTPVSNSSATIAPPDIISAYPPVQVAVKAVAEASPDLKVNNTKELQPQELTTASVPLPVSDNVYYIDPDAIVKVHPSADLFPSMEGESFETFKASIKAGQKVPVTIQDETLIDGRNRVRACKELGIQVMAVNWTGTGSLDEFIFALNAERRHLTSTQRAALAVRLLPQIEEQAAARMNTGVSNPVVKLRQGQKSVDVAGKKVNVSGSYVLAVKKILASSPELYQKLVTGEVDISEAKKQIRQAKATPVQPEQILFSVGEAVARLLDLIPEKDNPSLVEIAEHSPTAIRKAIEARLNPDTAEAPEPESIDARAGEAPVFNF